ncbi:MAG: ATP-binding protein [Desulfotomaculum sp.]|nr:ATP-binding protein [Desulfotomaculum sp.]
MLWRAIENLLSNVFAYALKESRVYLDIEDTDNKVSLTIKNISAYELNIPVNELMERFKRGDATRNTEGSGLGLAVVESLINLQKGSLNIEIDGDLFKAIIRMPKF